MNFFTAPRFSATAGRRTRTLTFAALVAGSTLVATALPQVVSASSNAKVTVANSTVAPSTACPWIAQNLHHRATAQHLAAEVTQRMTPAELAGFVVLQSHGSIENFNVGVPRLCIPAITMVDGPSGVAANMTGVTQFPSEIAVAASFNPVVARQVGFAMGQETLTKGFDVLQGPDLNLVRAPLSGRAFETYGEDPFLASVMGVAAIEGIQSTGVMAQAKHLGAYTQENGRARINQLISARVQNEIYNVPFKAAVRQAHVASMMCAMGAINATNTCSTPSLYASLRSWGFVGFTRSDLFAVSVPAPSFRAGMSLIKPSTPTQVQSLVSRGVVRASVLRRSVEAVLTEMFAYGLVVHPRTVSLKAVANSAAHNEVALRAARQGIVLLQNNSHVLPLASRQSVAVIGIDASQGFVSRGGGSSRVLPTALSTPLTSLTGLLPHAHITYSPGELNGIEFDPIKTADIMSGKAPLPEVPITTKGQAGKGDLAIDYAKTVTAAALTATSPSTGEGWNNWDVTFRAEKTGTYVLGLEDVGDTWLSLNGHVILADRGVHGPFTQSTSMYLIAGHHYTLYTQWFSVSAKTAPRFGMDYVQPQINAAVTAAKHARTAVIFAGNLRTEGADLASLSLQGDLNVLISAVAAVNPRTVVVLNTGGPILMPWKSQVAGVVEAWYGGQLSGLGIAQVLAGVIDPSGRLPVTMPASATQTPAASSGQFPGQRGVVSFQGLSDLGYRWYQANGVTPAFPFGYGLTYTSFDWSKVKIARAGGGVNASLTVTNTGKRAGVSVAEVYVGFPGGMGEPPEQLKGFARVELAPGASKKVTISLDRSAFAYASGRAMVVATGSYHVSLGTSSAQLAFSQSLSLR